MAEWAAKRFWTEVTVSPAEGGYEVLLDARSIRTPAGSPLVLPTAALAEALAVEWRAQGEMVDPRTMPHTRTANSAIDKVAPQREAVIDLLAEYAGTDLLSYRADRPEALVVLQSEAWDPLLDWAHEAFDARLATTPGVMPVGQPPAALANLAGPMRAMSDFELAAFHDLVALSGSLVLALAVTTGYLAPASAWDLSRLDEDWQAEEWGRDEEADAAAAIKRQTFVDAARFTELSRQL